MQLSSTFLFKAKQALRKQQTKVWKKLQQQKEQERRQKEEEQRKQEEEEERRKREEEIRKIRDLSNQEEQYNRFMKLVGGKRRSRSKVNWAWNIGKHLNLISRFSVTLKVQSRTFMISH